ncbi:hypothetical protein Tco_0209393 [Tanacetum coccineum]
MFMLPRHPRMPMVNLPQQLSQKAFLQLLKASYLINYLYQTLKLLSYNTLSISKFSNNQLPSRAIVDLSTSVEQTSIGEKIDCLSRKKLE